MNGPLEQFAIHSQQVADKLNDELKAFEENRKQMNKKRIAEEAGRMRTLSLPHYGDELPMPTMYSVVSVPTKPLHKFDAHDGEVHAVGWSKTGQLLATGGSDRKLKLWTGMTAGKCELASTLTGSNQAITSIDFDLEDRYIVAASNDFACRIWSSSDRRLRHTLTGHSGRVLASKFTQDLRVVTGSADRTLKLWDLHQKACFKTIFAGSSCHDLTVAGPMIISGHFDKKIRFWDTRASVENSCNEISLQGRVTSVDATADELLLGSSRDDTVKVFDLRRNQVVVTLYAEGFHVGTDFSRATFSPDGSYVCAGSQDGTIYVWSVKTSKIEAVLTREHNSTVLACGWSPRGDLVASVEKQKKAIVWTAF